MTNLNHNQSHTVNKDKSSVNQQLVGMNDAKKAIHRIWSDHFFGLGTQNEVKSLLLVGPPGTGKTQICILAAQMMGRKSVVLPMANTHFIKQKIYHVLKQDSSQVIILDQLEKAKKIVQDELLGIIEYGELSSDQYSNESVKMQPSVHAKNALFFATSNAGTQAIQRKPNLDDISLRKAVIADGVSAQVAYRFQSIVAVKNPTLPEFKLSLKMMLDKELKREGEKKNVKLVLDREDHFIEKSSELYHPDSNHRQVNQIITRVVREGIRNIFLWAQESNKLFKPGEVIMIDWSEDEIDQLKKPKQFSGIYRKICNAFMRSVDEYPLLLKEVKQYHGAYGGIV